MPLRSPLRLFGLLLVGLFMAAVPATATATATATEYAGDWVLKIAYTGLETGQPTTVPMPQSEQSPVMISVQKKETDDSTTNRYGVSIQVSNQFRTSMDILPSTNNNNNDDMDAIDMSGPLMSTRMMPPPAMREMELLVSTTIPTMTQINLLDDGTLELKGPDTIFLCQPVEAARKEE
eukprot:CAMPEP_0198282094 /NCGR_PEP_ID=MMETSP1449-20131203/1939_1 /TAXON_ID=420275 /ORGANISM="Attheya septentrionalis, Strain CCMP2084" /LENGTH=177 /DNA_ID=CAMNT_0043978177 /DNA_START=103 /DNA_END=636 /DNA_ORIENTATION=+